MKQSYLTPVSFLVLSGAFLLGCPNPNVYTTARTLPAGKFSMTVAPEVWGFSGDTVDSEGKSSTLSGSFPTLPTVGARMGVVENLEVGARLPNLSSVAGDVKYNAFKSDMIDVAVDPGLQYFTLGSSTKNSDGTTADASVTMIYTYLPAIVDINLDETFSVVLSPGAAYGYASTEVSGGDDKEQAASGGGWFATMGVGLDMRLGKSFSLHPAVNIQKSFKDTGAMMYVGGLGLTFGAQPSFKPTAQSL